VRVADIEVAIIGAGAVGLACAARLARDGRSVIVLERNLREAEESSTRNSGVIHAGLYYAPGSLKAITCVEGRERLYARCERENLPHMRCGKLVVATSEAERVTLEALLARGLGNGAGELRLIEAAEVRALEPNVQAVCALWSPETGVVDAHALCASYKREALAHGAEFAFGSEVEGVDRTRDGLRVRTHTRGCVHGEIVAEHVINAAGLGADRIAELAGLDIDALGYRLHPCKGDYFALRPGLRGLVTHLVYPVPAQAGLGIHLTLDLAGGLRAGPDTELRRRRPQGPAVRSRAAPLRAARARRRPQSRLRRRARQAAGSGPGAGRLRDRRGERARRAGAREPGRHRVAGADRERSDRRARGRAAVALTAA
jgi:L-2-hydroxyglutarate oxidase LhgO